MEYLEDLGRRLDKAAEQHESGAIDFETYKTIVQQIFEKQKAYTAAADEKSRNPNPRRFKNWIEIQEVCDN